MKILRTTNPKANYEHYYFLADTHDREFEAFMKAFQAYDAGDYFSYLEHATGSFEESIAKIEEKIAAITKALKTVDVAIMGDLGRHKMTLESRLESERRDAEIFNLCKLARNGDRVAARRIMESGITGCDSCELVDAVDPIA